MYLSFLTLEMVCGGNVESHSSHSDGGGKVESQCSHSGGVYLGYVS